MRSTRVEANRLLSLMKAGMQEDDLRQEIIMSLENIKYDALKHFKDAIDSIFDFNIISNKTKGEKND